jgi:hypothetical protein
MVVAIKLDRVKVKDLPSNEIPLVESLLIEKDD